MTHSTKSRHHLTSQRKAHQVNPDTHRLPSKILRLLPEALPSRTVLRSVSASNLCASHQEGGGSLLLHSPPSSGSLSLSLQSLVVYVRYDRLDGLYARAWIFPDIHAIFAPFSRTIIGSLCWILLRVIRDIFWVLRLVGWICIFGYYCFFLSFHCGLLGSDWRW